MNNNSSITRHNSRFDAHFPLLALLVFELFECLLRVLCHDLIRFGARRHLNPETLRPRGTIEAQPIGNDNLLGCVSHVTRYV